MLPQIPIALKSSYRRLGIVVDADVDPSSRWAQLVGQFSNAGLSLPRDPDPSGTVITGTGSIERVGVWLMPDNRAMGTLEDFVSRLVPNADPIWPHAIDATSRAMALGAPLKKGDRRKGELHTFLAWQARPGMPFGQAITAHALDSTGTTAEAFVHWIERTFAG